MNRPSSGRLIAVELRKSGNTMSGRLVLAALALLGAAGLALEVVRADTGTDQAPAVFAGYANAAMTAELLLPVVGVLLMTSEWSQRTALTTFALVPRRGRVLIAKLAAALVLSGVAVIVLAAMAGLTTLVVGTVSGAGVDFTGAGRGMLNLLASGALEVLLGAAFGALLQQSAVALVAVLLAPVVWSSVAPPLLGTSADWLDIFLATSTLTSLSLGDRPAQTLTAVTVWIVLPLLLGTWRALRRDVD